MCLWFTIRLFAFWLISSIQIYKHILYSHRQSNILVKHFFNRNFLFYRHKSTVAFPPHGPKDRFKVVKIVTSMPLRRGRWSVVDYPDKDKDKSTSKDLGQSSQQQLTSASVPASIVPQQPPPGTASEILTCQSVFL